MIHLRPLWSVSLLARSMPFPVVPTLSKTPLINSPSRFLVAVTLGDPYKRMKSGLGIEISIFLSGKIRDIFSWQTLRFCVTRRKDFQFEGVDESPAVGPIGSLSIRGKPGRLEGFQVAIDRAYSSFFPLRDLCYGQPVRAGLDCPDDTPLPG